MSNFVNETPMENGSKTNTDGSLILGINSFIFNERFCFIINSLIAKGSSADVYNAINIKNNMCCALKIFKIDRNIEATREISTLSLIQNQFNKNITNSVGEMIDYFEYESHFIIVFRCYLISLEKILIERKMKGLQLNCVQLIAKSIVPVLYGLHRVGITYCDIKPGNIMLDYDQNPILIDFCNAVNNPIEYSQSLYYKAPELILGIDFSPKIDVWALGCTLLELYIGTPVIYAEDDIGILQSIETMVGNIPMSIVERVRKVNPNIFYKNGRVNNPNKDTFWCPYIQKSIPELINAMNFYATKGKRLVPMTIEKQEKDVFIDLIMKMLTIDPHERISMEDIIHHPFMSYNFSNV